MPDSDAKTEVDFGIEIAFDRDSPDPARIFRTMTGLIESFQRFDQSLVKVIGVSIEPVLMLEDIEAGSIRTWLRDVISSMEDKALETGEWKKVIGRYLVRAKYIIVRFLDGKERISGREDIMRLQAELIGVAEETNIKTIPMYQPIPTPNLLGTIQEVNSALGQLTKRDKAKFISTEGEASLNLSFQFSLSEMEELLTREIIKNEAMLILKVKKPDYLGESKWEFRYEQRTIEVKILDETWLSKFQKRSVDVRPGDALRAQVRTEARYGYDGEVVGMNYFILQVIEVIAFNPPTNQPLLPE